MFVIRVDLHLQKRVQMAHLENFVIYGGLVLHIGFTGTACTLLTTGLLTLHGTYKSHSFAEVLSVANTKGRFIMTCVNRTQMTAERTKQWMQFKDFRQKLIRGKFINHTEYFEAAFLPEECFQVTTGKKWMNWCSCSHGALRTICLLSSPVQIKCQKWKSSVIKTKT